LGKLSAWRWKYARRLAVIDAAVVIWAVAGAFIVRFGIGRSPSSPAEDAAYFWLSILLVIVWWSMLGAWSSRDSRVLGTGSEEYKRVFAASLWLFGLIAIVSYVFRIDTARGYVGFALPVGLFGLLLARWLVRQHLGVDRQGGLSMSKVLIVGGPGAVSHLASSLQRSRDAGYLPIAAFMPGSSSMSLSEHNSGLPVLGTGTTAASVLGAIEQCGADAVAISAGVQLHPQVLRQIGWELASRNVGLIMAPALTDIAGPRIHTQQVAGLPLIHVTTPTLEAGQRVAKRLFDIFVSSVLIVLTAPLMIIVAIVVRLDSPGPILFRQERVGIRGALFEMLKFRSMVIDAESRLSELAHENQASGVLFKIKNDPRITRVGRVIRKYSLDELPQFFNILGGSMSLVGPRPPLPREVEAYEEDVRRRLLVKPGLTGLWQVSGRSNLSWQDSVRLDLYYVENWSLATDFIIILKTVRAVFRGSGAY
jgi:exopolysaccharide biosynthesis polyprenyl glycosylphosphotransferase